MRQAILGLCLTLGACALAVPALAADPLATVREFCRRDGLGERLLPRTWEHVAPLITWKLEPAWDTVTLIEGYKIGVPRREGEDAVTVEVVYVIVAEVSGTQVVTDTRNETHTHRLTQADGARWRIDGVPPRPAVFANQTDRDEMTASLDPDTGTFLSNSAFVWRMLKEAGIFVPRFTVADLAAATWLTPETSARPGDVVLYFDGEQPYHVGLYEDEETVVSATLNGGVRRTPIDAFPGTVRYKRVNPNWTDLAVETPTISISTEPALTPSEAAPTPPPTLSAPAEPTYPPDAADETPTGESPS